MLKRVHVKGYKCLHDVEVDLGPFNVLIGRNDSGKSSFMQAIAEPARALQRWSPGNFLDVSKAGWTVELEGTGQVLRYDAANFRVVRFRLPSAHAEGWQQIFFGDLNESRQLFGQYPELTSTEPVSLDPAQVASPSPTAQANLDNFVMSRGAGTAAHLAALALGDRDRFDAIEAALRDVTRGRVRNIVVKDQGGSIYVLAFKLVDGTLVSAPQMSQGLLLYVGFLALIERDPMPGVLLIEEPERGLHPHRLFDLVNALRALNARGIQIIIATHSPDLLSACAPSEVRIFYRPQPESPTQVHVLPADFERRAMREPLGQVWASRGEEGLLDLVQEPVKPAVRAEPG